MEVEATPITSLAPQRPWRHDPARDPCRRRGGGRGPQRTTRHVQVDEPGLQAERVAYERRAGTRRADDEDEPFFRAAPATAVQLRLAPWSTALRAYRDAGLTAAAGAAYWVCSISRRSSACIF